MTSAKKSQRSQKTYLALEPALIFILNKGIVSPMKNGEISTFFQYIMHLPFYELCINNVITNKQDGLQKEPTTDYRI